MTKIKFDLNWSGMLTTKNIHEVARLLHELLDDKTFTFSSQHEIRGYKTETLKGQKLNPSNSATIIVYTKTNNGFTGMYIHINHEILCITTRIDEDIFDTNFDNPFIKFEGKKVTITHRSNAGDKLIWILQI